MGLTWQRFPADSETIKDGDRHKEHGFHGATAGARSPAMVRRQLDPKPGDLACTDGAHPIYLALHRDGRAELGAAAVGRARQRRAAGRVHRRPDWYVLINSNLPPSRLA